MRPVYFELADLLITQALNAKDKITQQQLLTQAREISEILKSAELQNYFKDECVTSYQAKSTRLDNLDKTTAVLYPVITEKRLITLLSIGKTIYPFVADVDAKTLAK